MNARRHLFRVFAAAVLGAAIGLGLAAAITPVRIEQTVEAQFPVKLSFTAITSGEARLLVNIDADGKLADVMVLNYTDPAFAEEATAVLKRWRYRPATVDGNPTGVRFEIGFDFQSTGRVISLAGPESTNAFLDQMMPVESTNLLCPPAELDHPVEAIRTVSPLHPGRAGVSTTKQGTTVLDFYVDEKGMIRMPVVMQTTDRFYAEAAVLALSQWRFSTPTRKGSPVAVRLRQRFNFPEAL